jgi:hypothetical protein
MGVEMDGPSFGHLNFWHINRSIFKGTPGLNKHEWLGFSSV